MKKPTKPQPPFLMPPADISDVEPIEPTKPLVEVKTPKTSAQYQAAYRARMKADRTGGRLNTDLALKSLDNLAYIADHHKITKRAMLERLIDAEANKVALSNIAQSPPNELHAVDREALQREKEREMEEGRMATRAMMRRQGERHYPVMPFRDSDENTDQ